MIVFYIKVGQGNKLESCMDVSEKEKKLQKEFGKMQHQNGGTFAQYSFKIL